MRVFTGLTNVPASASNPARATAIYNIHHKPQMSSMSSSHNMQSYDGQSHTGTQQQSGLRSHLQQGNLSCQISPVRYILLILSLSPVHYILLTLYHLYTIYSLLSITCTLYTPYSLSLVHYILLTLYHLYTVYSLLSITLAEYY